MVHFSSILSESQEKKPGAGVAGRAKTILQFLKNFKDVQFAHFMVDALQPLSKLSRAFQKDSATSANAIAEMETCYLLLIDLQSSNIGPYPKRVIEAMAQKGSFRGEELEGFGADTLQEDRKSVTGGSYIF